VGGILVSTTEAASEGLYIFWETEALDGDNSIFMLFDGFG
jgi:hypothetical protein